MTEQHFGLKVRQILDEVDPIDQSMRQRLSTIRQQALDRQKTTILYPESAPHQHVISGVGTPRFLFSQFLTPILALILGVMAIQSWNQFQLAEEIEEIDTAVLTGELPIDAYVDAGFDSWLKRSFQ